MSGPRTSVDLLIRRTWNVDDGQGNSYGIIDVSPDDSDPAIFLGVRIGATGERIGKVVRPGDRFTYDGLDLTVAELDSGEPAWLRLTGTVPEAEGDS